MSKGRREMQKKLRQIILAKETWVVAISDVYRTYMGPIPGKYRGSLLIDRERKGEMREVVSSENYFFPKKSAGAK